MIAPIFKMLICGVFDTNNYQNKLFYTLALFVIFFVSNTPQVLFQKTTTLLHLQPYPEFQRNKIGHQVKVLIVREVCYIFVNKPFLIAF